MNIFFEFFPITAQLRRTRANPGIRRLIVEIKFDEIHDFGTYFDSLPII
jgi:hypothetical protein